MRKIIQIIAFLVLVAFYTATGQGVRGGHLENIKLGENITAPAMIYLDPVDGKAYKSGATDAPKGAQAVLLVSGSTDDWRQAHWGPCVIEWPSALTPGEKYYLSDTDGDVSTTPGTNEQFIGDVTANGLFSVNIAPIAAAGGGGGSGIPLDNTGLGLTGYGGDFIWKSSPGDFESGLVWDSYMSTTTGDIFPYQGAFVWYSGASESNPRAFFQANGEEVYFQFGAESPSVSNGIVNATSSGIIIEGNDLVGGRNRNINVKNEATTSNTDFVNSDGGFDFQSTTGALIPPKMTSTQRDALAPSSGWTIYNTTLNKTQTYDGSAWQSHW